MFLLIAMLIVVPTLVALVTAHKLGAAVVVYVVFSSIVDGMPAPEVASGIAYRWLYGVLHALAGNAISALRVFAPRLAEILSFKKQ